MKLASIYAVIAMLFAAAVAPAWSDDAHHPERAVSAKQSVLFGGEISAVDKEGGRLTIKHGPLDNLGMKAATTVFSVKELPMLEKLKVGGKVNFRAEALNGVLTVVNIESAI